MYKETYKKRKIKKCICIWTTVKCCECWTQMPISWRETRRPWKQLGGRCRRIWMPRQSSSKRNKNRSQRFPKEKYVPGGVILAELNVFIYTARGGEEEAENRDVGEHAARKELQRTQAFWSKSQLLNWVSVFLHFYKKQASLFEEHKETKLYILTWSDMASWPCIDVFLWHLCDIPF